MSIKMNWDRAEITSKNNMQLCLNAMNSKIANNMVRYYAVIFFSDAETNGVKQRHIYADNHAEIVMWLDTNISVYDTLGTAYTAYLNGEEYCTKGTLHYNMYDYCVGQKYDYVGNVYECIATNYIMNNDTTCVCLQNVNDDTYILIDRDKWLNFHHKYLIK